MKKQKLLPHAEVCFLYRVHCKRGGAYVEVCFLPGSLHEGKCIADVETCSYLMQYRTIIGQMGLDMFSSPN